MSHIQNFWINSTEAKIENRDQCCGCGSCSSVCPTSAITMQYDSEGFLYPVVNAESCIDCGMCVKSCPIASPVGQGVGYKAVYGGYSNDEHVINTSTSGGFATELSRLIIKKGGVVFGVRYNEDFTRAYYSSANTVDELDAFAGSKYMQSEKRDVFKNVLKELNDGRYVLFVGCPCDVASIKAFLKKDYDKLYTCELVCVGATTYRMLEDYKKYKERKRRKKVVFINARSKKKGWFVPHIDIGYEDGKYEQKVLFGSYFGHSLLTYVRPSCLKCRYRGDNGGGDYRIGDFWGIKQTDKYWNEKGASVILVRSDKGIQLLDEMKADGFVLHEETYEKAIANNVSIVIDKSERQVMLREKFAKIYREKGFVAACRKTASKAFWIKRYAPEKTVIFLKKVYHKLTDKKKI